MTTLWNAPVPTGPPFPHCIHCTSARPCPECWCEVENLVEPVLHSRQSKKVEPAAGQVWADEGTYSQGRHTFSVDKVQGGDVFGVWLTEEDGSAVRPPRPYRMSAKTLLHPLNPYRLVSQQPTPEEGRP